MIFLFTPGDGLTSHWVQIIAPTQKNLKNHKEAGQEVRKEEEDHLYHDKRTPCQKSSQLTKKSENTKQPKKTNLFKVQVRKEEKKASTG